jgi:hypothetical protein
MTTAGDGPADQAGKAGKVGKAGRTCDGLQLPGPCGVKDRYAELQTFWSLWSASRTELKRGSAGLEDVYNNGFERCGD